MMKSKVENYADIDIFCEINEGFSSFHKKIITSGGN